MYKLLENTPLKCELLHPVDVLFDQLIRHQNGDASFSKYINIHPLAIVKGYGKQTIHASAATTKSLLDISLDGLPKSFKKDTFLLFTEPIDFHNQDYRNRVKERIAKHLEFNWDDRLTEAINTFNDTFQEDPIRVIRYLIKLNQADLLHISNPKVFFKGVDNLVPKNKTSSMHMFQKLLAKDAIWINVEPTIKTSFTYQWLTHKPMDILVTDNLKTKDLGKPVVTATSRKHAITIIADHLLSENGIIFGIDGNSVSTQHQINEIICYPKLIRVTQEPMPKEIADRMNAELKNIWSYTAYKDQPIPHYIQAVANEL